MVACALASQDCLAKLLGRGGTRRVHLWADLTREYTAGLLEISTPSH
jgi:hypothetical protein